MPHRARIAAVAFEPDGSPDAALAAVAREMWARGAAVGGVLHRHGPPDAAGHRPLRLHMPHGGRRRREDLLVAEPGPPQDARAFERAAWELRAAIRLRCDLLLVARFERRGAAGDAMRDALADAVRADAPLLVGVRADLLGEWDMFLGAPTRRLPPIAEALVAWAEERVREPA